MENSKMNESGEQNSNDRNQAIKMNAGTDNRNEEKNGENAGNDDDAKSLNEDEQDTEGADEGNGGSDSGSGNSSENEGESGSVNPNGNDGPKIINPAPETPE